MSNNFLHDIKIAVVGGIVGGALTFVGDWFLTDYQIKSTYRTEIAGYYNSTLDRFYFYAGDVSIFSDASRKEGKRKLYQLNSYIESFKTYGAHETAHAARALYCMGKETLTPGSPGRREYFFRLGRLRESADRDFKRILKKRDIPMHKQAKIPDAKEDCDLIWLTEQY